MCTYSTVKRLIVFWLMVTPTWVFAASSRQVLGIGAVAENLLQPVGLASSLVNTACYVIGASFIFASIIKYFEHRRSPLMVTLGTVLFLFFSGVMLVLLPLITYYSGVGVSS